MAEFSFLRKIREWRALVGTLVVRKNESEKQNLSYHPFFVEDVLDLFSEFSLGSTNSLRHLER